MEKHYHITGVYCQAQVQVQVSVKVSYFNEPKVVWMTQELEESMSQVKSGGFSLS